VERHSCAADVWFSLSDSTELIVDGF